MNENFAVLLSKETGPQLAFLNVSLDMSMFGILLIFCTATCIVPSGRQTGREEQLFNVIHRTVTIHPHQQCQSYAHTSWIWRSITRNKDCVKGISILIFYTYRNGWCKTSACHLRDTQCLCQMLLVLGLFKGDRPVSANKGHLNMKKQKNKATHTCTIFQ